MYSEIIQTAYDDEVRRLERATKAFVVAKRNYEIAVEEINAAKARVAFAKELLERATMKEKEEK